jgi:hypothetical protein
MLRRVENVTVSVGEKGWLGSIKVKYPGWLFVFVGNKGYQTKGLWTEAEFRNHLNQALTYPVDFIDTGEKVLWSFQNRWYWDNENLTAEEVFAVLTARDVRAKKSIDRAKSIAGMASAPSPENRRGHISAELRQLVWMRDNGSCTNCGSNVELQFDHVIPVAMGGATNEGNLQILCGSCNRAKGNSVG